MLLNKGSSQTKSINKHLTIHIFDNPRKFYVIKQRKQSNQINKQTSHIIHIFDNPRKFYVIKQRKQSYQPNQLNKKQTSKQTSYYPHIR